MLQNEQVWTSLGEGITVQWVQVEQVWTCFQGGWAEGGCKVRSHVWGWGPCRVRSHIWRGGGPCRARSNASWVMVTYGPLPLNRITNTTENITFPQPCWQTVINESWTFTILPAVLSLLPVWRAGRLVASWWPRPRRAGWGWSRPRVHPATQGGWWLARPGAGAAGAAAAGDWAPWTGW